MFTVKSMSSKVPGRPLNVQAGSPILPDARWQVETPHAFGTSNMFIQNSTGKQTKSFTSLAVNSQLTKLSLKVQLANSAKCSSAKCRKPIFAWPMASLISFACRWKNSSDFSPEISIVLFSKMNLILLRHFQICTCGVV